MTKIFSLSKAFRLDTNNVPRVAFVGAGGKTTALFQAARELAPCIVTTTTHLGAWQAAKADRHIIFDKKNITQHHTALSGYAQKGVILVTGKQKNERLPSLPNDELAWLAAFCKTHSLPLLIEADGARKKPLKAPKAHEPVIPHFVDHVIVVAGLSGLGKTLNTETAYNPNGFAQLGESQEGTKITTTHLAKVLSHPGGGLKGIPPRARQIALLNQADTLKTQARGGKIAASLLCQFDTVILSSFRENYLSRHERIAGILLAAGGSSRYGKSKQLLDYQGNSFVRHIAKIALQAGLNPVIVVTGAEHKKVAQALTNLPVEIAHNQAWRDGQSASVKRGITALEKHTGKRGGAIFLLADQPQVTTTVLRALVEEHARTLNPVTAPMVEDRRANPVLWDRVTFPDLLKLQGDVGGRGIFSKFPPAYLHWNDSGLLLDVDTPEAYQKLLKR